MQIIVSVHQVCIVCLVMLAFGIIMETFILVRAVRSKKYVDCANWDKSMKLGTETHYRLYIKNFKGDTPRKSRDC